MIFQNNLTRSPYAVMALLLALQLWSASLTANDNFGEGYNACIPCAWNKVFSINDTILDVKMRDGSVLYDCRSAVRVVTSGFSGQRQGVRLTFWNNGICSDTILPVAEIESFRIGDLGIFPPLIVDVMPVREYHRVSAESVPTRFLDIVGLGGFGGSDESTREIGFESLYFGAEALVGIYLNSNIAVGLGGGVLSEAGRLRIPLMAHSRWRFLNSPRIVDSIRLIPDPCRFQSGENIPPIEPPEGYTESRTSGAKDSTAILLRDKAAEQPWFQPFVFVEGGLILDSGFEGSGSEPPINPEDYRQFFFGGGVGMPIDRFTISLAFRFLRLNLRTPCDNCPDRFIVNTNEIGSIVLKAGVQLPW